MLHCRTYCHHRQGHLALQTAKDPIMTLRPLLVALALSTGIASANAAEIKSASGGSVDLGTLSGVAYYTAEPKGFRVVVTLAPRAAAPAVRFETVLAADQSVTLSTPRGLGAETRSVEISRIGDRVVVSPLRAAGITQEAAALN